MKKKLGQELGVKTTSHGEMKRWCHMLFYIKKYLKAKDKLWKLKYFTMAKM